MSTDYSEETRGFLEYFSAYLALHLHIGLSNVRPSSLLAAIVAKYPQ